MPYYVLEGNNLIPITNRSQIKIGSIIAMTDGLDTVFFMVDGILPSTYINNWIPTKPNIMSLYAIRNPNLFPYFSHNVGDLSGFLYSDDLSGLFSFVKHIFSAPAHFLHHIGHQIEKHVFRPITNVIVPKPIRHLGTKIFHSPIGKIASIVVPVTIAPKIPAISSIEHAIEASKIGHAISTIGKTVSHVISPVSETISSIAHGAISTAKQVVPVVGHVIGGIGKHISKLPSLGHIATGVAKVIASQIAGQLLSKPPQMVVVQGAQDLGYSPDIASTIDKQVSQYASKNNISSDIVYQKTMAYVANHWDYFSRFYKTPEAAVVDILLKNNGVPPSPDSKPESFVGVKASTMNDIIPYMGIGIAAVLFMKAFEQKYNKGEASYG